MTTSWPQGGRDYRVRVPVRRYDVTDLVAAATATGRLCWAATIADGWYCGYLGMDRRRQACWYGTTPAFRAVLVIETGSEVIHVGTDESWRRATGAIAYADLLMGQLTDLRNEPDGLEAGWIRRRALVDGELSL